MRREHEKNVIIGDQKVSTSVGAVCRPDVGDGIDALAGRLFLRG